MNEQVNAELKPSWQRRTGVFFAWSGGIAGVTVVSLIVIWLIINLFTRGASLAVANLSDWMFWGFAALLGIGVIAPNEQGLEKSIDLKTRTSKRFSSSSTSRATTTTDDEPESEPVGKFEERRQQAMRKRIARVYNPWRWRFWMSSLFVIGLSILFGMLG